MNVTSHDIPLWSTLQPIHECQQSNIPYKNIISSEIPQDIKPHIECNINSDRQRWIMGQAFIMLHPVAENKIHENWFVEHHPIDDLNATSVLPHIACISTRSFPIITSGRNIPHYAWVGTYSLFQRLLYMSSHYIYPWDHISFEESNENSTVHLTARAYGRSQKLVLHIKALII